MGDRAKESAAARLGDRGVRGAWPATALPLALYCSVTGILAVGVGALAALLVPDGAARGLVWLVVTVLVAVGAGLWWGLTPVSDRLQVLNRLLAAGQTRQRHR
ncbi:hypothetical protein [Streptomyces sp. NPDC047061]|uniref:hypothetical protein n=1 Tax=Streptomyces sp. NPDC047061 TaxID=3154605 RepID=UPI0034114B3C